MFGIKVPMNNQRKICYICICMLLSASFLYPYLNLVTIRASGGNLLNWIVDLSHLPHGDRGKSSFSLGVQSIMIIGEKWIKYHTVVEFVSSINTCIVTIENVQFISLYSRCQWESSVYN